MRVSILLAAGLACAFASADERTLTGNPRRSVPGLTVGSPVNHAQPLTQATTSPTVQPTSEPAVQQSEATGQPTTQPTTQATAIDAEKMLERLLRAKPGSARPLEPVRSEEVKPAGRKRAEIAPQTPPVPLKREGDVISQRVGRLRKSDDGQSWLFQFDSDERALMDPPMVLLPNQKLLQMEQTAEKAGVDLRFRVTGMVTSYRGQNYLLVEKVDLVPDHEGL